MFAANLSIDNPRISGREAVRQSLPVAQWQANENFSRRLQMQIAQHTINQHPIIQMLEVGLTDLGAQQYFHLEFRHAFAQIFTDGLIRAMFTSMQLETRLGAVGKVSARFLLQLNVLDELGFIPGGEEYAGNPRLAHYIQFAETLQQLQLNQEQINQYQPSEAARACRATFEDQYDDHVLLTAVLATSESIFTKFCGPWAKSVGVSTAIDVQQGYHSIHVEHDGGFIDDDHSEDAWYVLRQALTTERYEEVSQKITQWLDTWEAFLNHLLPGAAKLAA